MHCHCLAVLYIFHSTDFVPLVPLPVNRHSPKAPEPSSCLVPLNLLPSPFFLGCLVSGLCDSSREVAHRASRWSGSGCGAATDWGWALSRLGFDLDVPCFLTHSEARVWTLDVWNSRHVLDDRQVERNWTRFACGAVHTTCLGVCQQQSSLVLFALVFPSALCGSL